MKLPPYHTLRDLPGVGPASERDLQCLGVMSVKQLVQADPEELYRRLERLDGPTDRCMLYVFRCARYAAASTHPEPALLHWWAWRDDAPLVASAHGIDSQAES